MKKSLLLAGMLAVGLANAQTGKVGINTENPNETLEINGTLRVDNLPESGVGTIYDGAETAGTTFTGTRTLVADEKGNIGYLAGAGDTPFSQEDLVKVGTEVNDSVTTLTAENTTFSNVNSINTPVKNGSFTLTKKSVVFFNVALSTQVMGIDPQQVQLPDGNVFNTQVYGAQTKRIGFELELNGKNILLVSVPLTQMNPAMFDYITNQVTGTFSIPGSRTIVLEPGTYNYELRFRFQKHSSDRATYRLIAGSGPMDVLDVVAIPIE